MEGLAKRKGCLIFFKCLNESRFHSYRTLMHYIGKLNPQSNFIFNVYFMNIRLFSRIFCKNTFYSFIQNLLQGVMIKTLYFHENNSPTRFNLIGCDT